jgi:hypothetical protein
LVEARDAGFVYRVDSPKDDPSGRNEPARFDDCSLASLVSKYLAKYLAAFAYLKKCVCYVAGRSPLFDAFDDFSNLPQNFFLKNLPEYDGHRSCKSGSPCSDVHVWAKYQTLWKLDEMLRNVLKTDESVLLWARETGKEVRAFS